MGPLPQLHRFLVATLLLTLCLAGGIWLAGVLDLPMRGIGVGLGVGLLVVRPRERPVRISRRR